MPLNSNQHQAAWQQPTASKFQKWGQERDAFLKEAENANRERERVEKRMEELRAKQTELHEEILHTTNNVGRIHRDREMLTKEKARLEKVYQEEHAELAKCAKDSDDFAMKVKLEKKEYARVMQEMSGELGDLLMKQEDFRLQQLITVETLPVIVEHHKRVDASPDTDNGSLENIVMLMDPLKRKTHEMVEAMNALKEKKNTLHAIRQGVLRGSITVKGSSGKVRSIHNPDRPIAAF